MLLFCFVGWHLSPTIAQFFCDTDYDCLPNGSCSSDLSCLCNSGFVGPQCENNCPLKCQNGGYCVEIDEHGGVELEHYCECPSTHSGGLCQVPVNGASLSQSSNDNAGRFVGIVVVVLCLVIVVGGLCWWYFRRHKKTLEGNAKDSIQNDGTNNDGLPPIE